MIFLLIALMIFAGLAFGWAVAFWMTLFTVVGIVLISSLD